MKKQKRRRQYGVTPEQFVVIWETSDSLAQAAARLGMPPGVASARASRYRRLGVNLKRFRGGGLKMDIDALRRLIREPESPENPQGPRPMEDTDSAA